MWIAVPSPAPAHWWVSFFAQPSFSLQAVRSCCAIGAKLLLPFLQDDHWTLLAFWVVSEDEIHGSLMQFRVGMSLPLSVDLCQGFAQWSGLQLRPPQSHSAWFEADVESCGCLRPSFLMAKRSMVSCSAEKSGAGIANPKAKKMKPQCKKPTGAPLHTDPAQLQLSSGSFVTESGQGLDQLSLEEVTTQSAGVCFVSFGRQSPGITPVTWPSRLRSNWRENLCHHTVELGSAKLREEDTACQLATWISCHTAGTT